MLVLGFMGKVFFFPPLILPPVLPHLHPSSHHPCEVCRRRREEPRTLTPAQHRQNTGKLGILCIYVL